MLSPTYAFDLDCDVESLLFQAEEHTAFTFEPLTPPQQQSRSYSVDDYYSRSNSTSSSYNSQVVIASNGFVIPNDQFSAYEFLLACSTNLASSQQQQTPETRPLPLQRPMPMLMPVIAPVMNPASPPMPTAMPAPRPVPMPIRSASGTCPTTPILPSHNCSYATTDNTNNATKATNLPARAASAPLMAALPSKPPKPKPVCVNCGGTETSVWRKDRLKNPLCNACGLFRKQHGYDRPQSFPFRKTSVQRRKGKKALPRS